VRLEIFNYIIVIDRIAEGVWMSVSPTDDALIVALDFEGSWPCSDNHPSLTLYYR
jgi:hypothetical protein